MRNHAIHHTVLRLTNVPRCTFFCKFIFTFELLINFLAHTYMHTYLFYALLISDRLALVKFCVCEYASMLIANATEKSQFLRMWKNAERSIRMRQMACVKARIYIYEKIGTCSHEVFIHGKIDLFVGGMVKSCLHA